MVRLSMGPASSQRLLSAPRRRLLILGSELQAIGESGLVQAEHLVVRAEAPPFARRLIARIARLPDARTFRDRDEDRSRILDRDVDAAAIAIDAAMRAAQGAACEIVDRAATPRGFEMQPALAE